MSYYQIGKVFVAWNIHICNKSRIRVAKVSMDIADIEYVDIHVDQYIGNAIDARQRYLK